jgi:hypothetical protein
MLLPLRVDADNKKTLRFFTILFNSSFFHNLPAFNQANDVYGHDFRSLQVKIYETAQLSNYK